MGRLSGPRHRLAGLAFLLAFAVLLAVAVPALADYLGPNRTVTTWEWRRLQCHYEAVYNPPGAGWYGCTLDLYNTPASNCPSAGSVTGYFTPSTCSWPSDFCQSPGCSISLSASVEGCSEGQTGCTAVSQTTTLPEATVSGSLSCAVPGAGGWCLAGADLSLTGSEPLAGYTILALEGTRNIIPGGGGETFACPGDACGVPLLEGSNDFTFWAISSWGDTSLMGSASGGLDTQPPVISGEISGAAGDNGWYLSDVAFSGSASDPSPGSGLLSFELSLDGGGWAAYTGPLTFSDGSHTVDLRAGDTAGNMSTQSPTVRVDTQPPGLDLIANASFCPGCGEPLGVAVDVQDAGSGVVEWTLSADAGLVASGSGSTSQVLPWDGSGLPGGPYTLSLRARDAAGNTSESSLAVNLLVPTPSPPPAELPPAETPPGSGPTWSTAVQLATPTVVPTATRPSHPTRTPEVIPFGGVPAAPLGNEGEDPRSNPPAEILGGPQPSVPGSSSGVLWGGAALALIGAATAIALDQARRRREEEARQREEMERRNAAQRAREEAEQARIAAAAAVRAQQVQVSPDYGAIVGAALGAAGAEERIRAAQDRRVERREEEMEAAELAARERAAAEAVRQAEEAARAAALAQAERLRAIAEGRDEPPPSSPTSAAIQGSWFARTLRGWRSGQDVMDASRVAIHPLESGHVSIRVSPEVPVGSRIPLRQRFGLAGTRYNPETVIENVGRNRISRAVSRSSVLFSLGTSLLGNLWDYTLGEHHEEGLGREFLVSTASDFLLAMATGVAAAGIVVAMGLSLPVWGTVAAVSVIGVAIGFALDQIGVGDWLKSQLNAGLEALGVRDTPIPGTDRVEEGLEAWPGIFESAGVILRVGAQRVGQALGEAGRFLGGLFGR